MNLFYHKVRFSFVQHKNNGFFAEAETDSLGLSMFSMVRGQKVYTQVLKKLASENEFLWKLVIQKYPVGLVEYDVQLRTV